MVSSHRTALICEGENHQRSRREFGRWVRDEPAAARYFGIGSNLQKRLKVIVENHVQIAREPSNNNKQRRAMGQN
jgi:hypothetical protein